MNSNISTFPTYFHWLVRLCSPRAVTPTTTLSREDGQHFHLAFHCAYRAFAQSYPQWVSRSFDADLLRPELAKLYSRSASNRPVLSSQAAAIQLALRWDGQFGAQFTPEERIRRIGELTNVATGFLGLLDKELRLIEAINQSGSGVSTT